MTAFPPLVVEDIRRWRTAYQLSWINGRRYQGLTTHTTTFLGWSWEAGGWGGGGGYKKVLKIARNLWRLLVWVYAFIALNSFFGSKPLSFVGPLKFNLMPVSIFLNLIQTLWYSTILLIFFRTFFENMLEVFRKDGGWRKSQKDVSYQEFRMISSNRLKLENLVNYMYMINNFFSFF